MEEIKIEDVYFTTMNESEIVLEISVGYMTGDFDDFRIVVDRKGKKVKVENYYSGWGEWKTIMEDEFSEDVFEKVKKVIFRNIEWDEVSEDEDDIEQERDNIECEIKKFANFVMKFCKMFG